MVSVVQLVEHRIVVPSVVGSSPITHPKQESRNALLFWLIQGALPRHTPPRRRSPLFGVVTYATFLWGDVRQESASGGV